MGNRVYVGNLSYGTTQQMLRDSFSESGTVTDVKIMTDRETGQSRGFGFVTFASDAEANAAMVSWNGANLDGRRLVVNEARERTQNNDGGGYQRPNGGYASQGGGYQGQGGYSSQGGGYQSHGGGGYPNQQGGGYQGDGNNGGNRGGYRGRQASNGYDDRNGDGGRRSNRRDDRW